MEQVNHEVMMSAKATGPPLKDAGLLNLYLQCGYFCAQAYEAQQDDSAMYLLDQVSTEPDFASVADFKVFEPTGDKGVRGIVFTMNLSNLNKVGLASTAQPTKCAVVAYRGTTDKTEFAADIESLRDIEFPSEVPGRDHQVIGRAGYGFVQVYHELAENGLVAKAIELCSQCEGRLLITGHSLGGALAHLLAFDVHAAKAASSIALITFGEPRTLAVKTAQENMDTPYYFVRLINALDPIPMCVPLINHRHTGDVYYYVHEQFEPRDKTADFGGDEVTVQIRKALQRHSLMEEHGYMARIRSEIAKIPAPDLTPSSDATRPADSTAQPSADASSGRCVIQ